MRTALWQTAINKIHNIPSHFIFGYVRSILGLLIEVEGIEDYLSIGSRCKILSRNEEIEVEAEVVGFRHKTALLMAYHKIEGIGIGCRVEVLGPSYDIYPSDDWLGRVINPFGEAIDGKGPLLPGLYPVPLKNQPPAAQDRQRVAGKIDLGVRALNTFLTCCQGQRFGIFSGSGVGKSVLMSMLAKYTQADVNVIGLIGERGREVKEFIEDDLGVEGLKRTVLVISTSDETPLMRRQAAYMTMAVAEYFRDQGKKVFCMMDSITRFAMAQREIGLSAGEPPTTKGYPPTTYSELAKLLERAGPGVNQGSITGFFTVLVEGDDLNEPISDTVRGIVDGHIVLDRKIADRGRFPAVNVLKSISRMLPGCNDQDQNHMLSKARKFMALYEDMAEMIRLGAYRRGSDAEVDQAIFYHQKFEEFLAQDRNESSTLEEGYQILSEILSSYGSGE